MTDIVKELLDEDAFDPKKLFNEEEYSTLIIKRDGFNKKENNTADLLESLLDKEITRQESEEIFLKLKESNAVDVMVDAVKKAQRVEERIILAAACWESCLDFTNHFLFFVDLACSDNLELSLEGLTVVENCEGTIDENTLSKALEIAQSSKSKNKELLAALIDNIKQRAY
jgi:tRNA(Phe) wybutosine-synthesizing methylase Tyw3